MVPRTSISQSTNTNPKGITTLKPEIFTDLVPRGLYLISNFPHKMLLNSNTFFKISKTFAEDSNRPPPICGILGSYLESHIQINVEVIFFTRFKITKSSHLYAVPAEILLSCMKMKLQVICRSVDLTNATIYLKGTSHSA